ncbi:hypothetical protein F4805DRAFT_429679 [Annulohypoxylon moriforme]|nr:hypothetical protein F4805DRAFT_429679 [Annulohypoxylon moriforme]
MDTFIMTPVEHLAETASPPQFVTIEKRNFEKLMRRTDVLLKNEHPKLDSVMCIPLDEYEGFLQIQTQYANLVHNLLVSGVSPENVWSLAQDTIQSPTSASLKPLATLSPMTGPIPSQQETNPAPSNREEADNSGSRLVYPPSPANTDPRGGRHITSPDSADMIGSKTSISGYRGPTYPLKAKRSIVLEGLPTGATCLDVTSAIRGGALVEFTMLEAKRMAIVSFLSPDSAMSFFEHSKKKGLYINDAKIALRWPEKQYTIPSFISIKAGSGATRNLVLKACRSQVTEDRIRKDLEHIHRLVVIKIEFVHGDCHIETNSIQLAIYARSCMMSRVEYHGISITWASDECDQPFATPQKDVLTKKSWRPQDDGENFAAAKKLADKIRNRFSSLKIEGDGDADTV